MEFFASTRGAQGIAQTVRRPFEPIVLSIGHFKGPSEVQLNSWWKTFSL